MTGEAVVTVFSASQEGEFLLSFPKSRKDPCGKERRMGGEISSSVEKDKKPIVCRNGKQMENEAMDRSLP